MAFAPRAARKNRCPRRADPYRAIPSGVEEHVRVSIGRVGDKLVATPLGRGAGNITPLTRAQGDVRIPEQAEGP